MSDKNAHATELDFLSALELLQVAYKVCVWGGGGGGGGACGGCVCIVGRGGGGSN